MIRGFFNRYPKIRDLAKDFLELMPFNRFFNQRFWTWTAFYFESETWNVAQIEDYQLTRLRELLFTLVDVSPFYRERITVAEIEGIGSLDDFRAKIPELSRSDFRDNFSRILAEGVNTKRLLKVQTSGTTGHNLQFFRSRADDDREWATICYQWARVGYEPGKSRRAEFRSFTRGGRLVDVVSYQNMIHCSILDFSKSALQLYADKIRQYKIKFFLGYPSSMFLLTCAIEETGISFPAPEAIMLASEQVTDHHLRQIEKIFPNAKLFAHYGCTEQTVMAGWCEHSRVYHVLPQYGICEIDPENHEIIGTNLYNAVNGFVRYPMSDIALAYETTPCPYCHRPYPLRIKEMGGRLAELVFSPEKGWISSTVVRAPIKYSRVIREFRILQEEENAIIFQYTVGDVAEDELEAEKERLRTAFLKILGNAMQVHFERVEDFERGPTGKFRCVVSKLETPYRKRNINLDLLV